MRNSLILGILLLSAAFCQHEYINGAEPPWVAGTVLVAFEPEPELSFTTTKDGVKCGIAQIDNFLRECKITNVQRLFPKPTNPKFIAKNYGVRNWFKFSTTTDSIDIPALAKRLENCPQVSMAQADHILKKYRTPNDPMYSTQWHLSRIFMPVVWDFTTNATDVTFSVLEGTEWYHPDLQENIWVNPGEDMDDDGVVMDPDDMDGIDNDGNGFIDDLIGWDFTSSDNDPDDDDIGHGTMCTGTVAAVGDNSRGVSGVVWRAKSIVLRSDEEDHHVESAVLGSIQYARGMDMNVYSLSYGSTYASPMPRALYQSAYNDGAVLLGAAGNENISDISYPAGYTFILAVAATDQHDLKADFSCYGTWVDISAPGVGIRTTALDGGYDNPDGTSFSCPCAAGLAVFLVSMFPDSTPASIYRMMQNGADPIDEYNPSYVGMLGTGRINAGKTLYQWRYPYLNIDSLKTVDAAGGDRVSYGENGEMRLFFTNDPAWQPGTNLMLKVRCYNPHITITDSTATLGSVAPGASVNNATDPIRFTTSPTYFEGDSIEFHIIITSTSSDYRKYDVQKVLIGYYPVLIYDLDGTNRYSSFITRSLNSLGIENEVWVRAASGTIDATFLNAQFQTAIVLGGSASTEVLSSTERTMFSAFAHAGNNLIFSGQYLADELGHSDAAMLSSIFGATHVADSIDRSWGMTVEGIAGDPIAGGMTLRCIGSTDAANNQTSFGKCASTGSGTAFLQYSGHTGEFCAVRNLLISGAKTAFLEFGLEGITNGSPGTTRRNVFLDSLLTWMGHLRIDEAPKPEIPNQIRLRAYPNPFNSEVSINFSAAGEYDCELYNVRGQLIRHVAAGNQHGDVQIIWDGTDDFGVAAPTGVYFAVARAKNRTAVCKLTLIK